MIDKKPMAETFLLETFSDVTYLILYAAGHASTPVSDLEDTFYEVIVFNFIEGFENVLFNSSPDDCSFIEKVRSSLELELEEGNHLDYAYFENNLLGKIIKEEDSPLCHAFFKQSIERMKVLRKMGD